MSWTYPSLSNFRISLSVIRFQEIIHICLCGLFCFNCQCSHFPEAWHSFFLQNEMQYLNKRVQPKKGPLTEEKLSNLPLFCIWVTYSLWYWESLKASRAERGGREKKIQHCITALLFRRGFQKTPKLFFALAWCFSSWWKSSLVKGKQWCTPIPLYYSLLRAQMGSCFGDSHPKLHLPGFLLLFGFPFIDFFFFWFNLPLIHLFVFHSWSTDHCESDAPAAEAPAGWARDYSHYSTRLHWALVLCATSPLVRWQSEL